MPLRRMDSRRSQVSLTASATAEEDMGGVVFDMVCGRDSGWQVCRLEELCVSRGRCVSRACVCLGVGVLRVLN